MTIEKCRACKGTGEQQGGPGDGAQCLQCGGAGKVRVVDVNDPGYHSDKSPQRTNARYERNWYYCWLIEERSEPQPRWLTATTDLTVHAHEALWFARKADAERAAAEDMRGGLIVCEHGFAQS